MNARKLISGTVALLLLSVSAWASDTMKAKIQIHHTVHIGSNQLAPGEYKMTWTESGSSTEVTFWQDKKVVATVPADEPEEAEAMQSSDGTMRCDQVHRLEPGQEVRAEAKQPRDIT
jgi:hypothetical protein